MNHQGKNRFGRIEIARDIIERAASGQDPQGEAAWSAVFQKFIPIRAQEDWRTMARTVEYIGYCRDFDEIPEGVQCPLYNVIISRKVSTDGPVEVVSFTAEFKRKESVGTIDSQ